MSTSQSRSSVELDKAVEVELLRLSDKGDVDHSFTIKMKWINTITDVRNCICQRNSLSPGRVDVIFGGKRLPSNYNLYQLNVTSNFIKLFYFCHSPRSSLDCWIHIISPSKLDKVLVLFLYD